MKTKFRICIISLMAIFSVSLLASCDSSSDNSDTTKPVIDIIEPAEGDILTIGDENGVHLEMDLSDNVMLRSYKVDIHPNFDGHSHEESVSRSTTNFTFNKAWDVSNLKNTHIHHHEILIPANATPGKYHFMVYCTDMAGNESHIVKNIVLATK